MLNRSVSVQRCLTNSMRKSEIRVKLLHNPYWSDANNIRAQSIRRLPKDNVTITNTNTTKLSRKSDSSFPDIRLRDFSASRPKPKIQACSGHAFEGLQRREFTAQKTKKITGTDFIFPVIELFQLVLRTTSRLREETIRLIPK